MHGRDKNMVVSTGLQFFIRTIGINFLKNRKLLCNFKLSWTRKAMEEENADIYRCFTGAF